MSILSGYMILKTVDQMNLRYYVCQELIEISRQIAEHAADVVKGERASANMFEIN